MSFWGRLFGSDKSTEKLIDNVSSGIDKLWYTEEEKAEDRANARREGQALLIGWLQNTQGANLSRRLIAISITFGWLLMKFAGVGVSIVGVWSDLPPEKIIATNTIIENFSSDMTGAVMLILSFYFAAPHMGKVVDVAMNSFARRNKVVVEDKK